MMLKYALHKILYSLLILWGVFSIVFLLFNVLPADPARLVMGQRSDEASVNNARKELHLDKSLIQRYALFLNDLSPISIYPSNEENKTKYNYIRLISFENDALVLKQPYLGRSYRTKKLVSDSILEALPGTMILAFSSMFFACIIGITLGVVAAVKKDTLWDTSAVAASVVGISMPSFFAGLLIAYIGGFLWHQITGLNMTGSLFQYDPISGTRYLALRNLILPTLALGLRPLAIITQLMRSAMLDVLSQDYIRTAKAKGLNTVQVVFKHAIPNALNPVITAITGWFAELLAGSFFVEYIFGWKGLGKLTVDALDKFDFPLVMGAVLVTAFIFVIMNLITDVLYAQLDPRIRLHD